MARKPQAWTEVLIRLAERAETHSRADTTSALAADVVL
jgi:hypothetical protein